MDTSALRRLLTYLVAGGLALGVGVRVLEPPRQPAAPVRLEADGAGAGSGTTGPDGAAERIYVDVAGAVRRPGLYRMRADARVGDAVERAGGRTSSAAPAGINLAARLEDGQQVVVAVKGQGPAAPHEAGAQAPAPASPASSGPAAARLDLATATAEQIDAAAEGIGPTLAARVVEYRDQSGGLSSVEQLREVPGIGEARLQALAEVFGP